MELYLDRKWYSDNTTIGELFIDENMDQRECFILEPTVRQGKDPRGIVAIPQGRYEITLYDSPHFNMKVPLLNNIPGHEFVEIHPGNTEQDTHDCLLPGLERGVDMVVQSRLAFLSLFNKIQDAIEKGPVFINIRNTAIPKEEKV